MSNTGLDETRSLPSGWRSVAFGEVIRESQAGFASGKRDPNGIVQLRMNNVTTQGGFDWGTIIRVPTDGGSLGKYLLQPGDILFNNTNSAELVGKSALFQSFDEPVVYSNHFTRLRPHPDLADSAYLSLLLQLQWKQGVFEAMCNRWVGQAAVQRDKLFALPIPLPPLAEQRRIAARLGEALAAVARARAAAAAQVREIDHYVPAAIGLAFRDLDTEACPKPRIEEFARTASGSTPSRQRPDFFRGRIPWVKTGELLDGVITDTEEHVSERAIAETALKLYPPQTLLIAMYGQGRTRGRTGLLSVDATSNQACFAILPSPGVVDSRYLQWWFRANYDRLRTASEGRGGNQPNLNGELLRAERVPLPSVEDQRRIVHMLDEKEANARDARDAAILQLAAIEKLRAAVLQRAFVGQLGAT